MRTEFVCGFYFFPIWYRRGSAAQSDFKTGFTTGVVLIQKVKPAWQSGLLNGVGGKIELGETPLDAMRREFAEETGYPVTDWELFDARRFDESLVHFFRSFGR